MTVRRSIRALACAALAASAGWQPLAAADGTQDDARAAAIEGTWLPTAYSPSLLTSDGKTPPLTAEAADLYRARIADKGNPDRQFDRTVWCAGPGMPRIMFMPYPFEIRIDRDFVGFIYGWYRWHRVADMSGAEADPILPQTMGYSVARWEGDTLIVETVGTTDETVLDAMGLPHSEDMRIVERIRRLPNGQLEDRFTITDPGFYTAPWEAVMTYRAAPEMVVGDDLCPDRLRAGEPATRVSLP